MAFLMNEMFGSKLKRFSAGGDEDVSKAVEEGGKETQSKSVSMEEFGEYQKQVVEET